MVSTMDTPDYGLETAILAKNGTFPVERYEDCEGALKGHKRWKEYLIKINAWNLKPTVTCLGTNGIGCNKKNEKITLDY